MRTRVLGLSVVAALVVSTLGVGTAVAGPRDDRGGSSRMATLNVVHGIPGVDVEVCVDGAVAIADFNPGEVATGVELPRGRYDVAIVPLGEDCHAAILEADGIRLRGGRNYTAVAHLTEDGDPTLALFKNNVRPLRHGLARLTVRHTAAAPEVDVWANGKVLLEDVPNGASATLKVRRGVYAAWVSLPGDFVPVIGPAVLNLQRATAYEVYAWGSMDAGYDFAVVLTDLGRR